ncbi:TetR/AcrR family transcriptional regulator [Nocardiopsis sediminis]|uniref:TetR/AcrR family transcriptional regulator n=1 Tax=Nocardiopsis sediminis TaxID=1778267 RepID=A0ABV8FJM2_9ACTN
MRTRDDWLTEGLAALVAEGEPGVRIDKLARRLGMTKGSFHHHFRGMADYRRALLERYEADQRAVQERLAALLVDTPAEAVIAGLPSRVADLVDTDLERAIRAWGVADQDVRETQERIDAARLAFLQDVWFQVLGDEGRARTAALVPHLIMVGAGAVRPRLGAADVQAVFDLLGRLVAVVADDGPTPEA